MHVPAKIFQVVSHSIEYSLDRYPNGFISCIELIDLKTDGTGAYPSIKSGGVGKKDVKIYFESRRSHGIHFNVTIYGR